VWLGRSSWRTEGGWWHPLKAVLMLMYMHELELHIQLTGTHVEICGGTWACAWVLRVPGGVPQADPVDLGESGVPTRRSTGMHYSSLRRVLDQPGKAAIYLLRQSPLEIRL
jgi:hypothetical protein